MWSINSTISGLGFFLIFKIIFIFGGTRCQPYCLCKIDSLKIVLACSSSLQPPVPHRGCCSKNEISFKERNSDSLLLDVGVCLSYVCQCLFKGAGMGSVKITFSFMKLFCVQKMVNSAPPWLKPKISTFSAWWRTSDCVLSPAPKFSMPLLRF